MSRKRHILSFGSHWEAKRHALNISRNAFHSIPRQKKNLKCFICDNIYRPGRIQWHESLEIDYRGRDESLGSGKINYSRWLNPSLLSSSLRCAQCKAFWEVKVWAQPNQMARQGKVSISPQYIWLCHYFTHSFIRMLTHPDNRYLLSIYCALNTNIGTRDTVINKTEDSSLNFQTCGDK